MGRVEDKVAESGLTVMTVVRLFAVATNWRAKTVNCGDAKRMPRTYRHETQVKGSEVALMAVQIRPRAKQTRVELYAEALERWRTAEWLVSERWSAFLTAERESRPGAFAAYAIALSAEESAADDLALLQLSEAA
jgi:hypothetical protein